MLFRVLNQPKQESAGDRIKVLLRDAHKGQFSRVTLVAAFAKRAGIGRISSELKKTKAKGISLTGIVGIDHGGTTKEGLRDVYGLCDQTYVVHSTRKDVTFHSKAYVFEGAARTVLLVGSSNLTCGGLFTNIELCTETEFSLPAENAQCQAALTWLRQLTDASLQHVALLNKQEMLAVEKMLSPEVVSIGTSKPTSRLKNSKGGSLFGPGTFPAAPPLASTAKAKSGATPKGQTVPPGQLPSQGAWKKLSSFDVNPKSAPGSMIIPKALVPVFPTLGPRQLMASGGYQSEVTFKGRYIDGTKRKIDDRRLIRYEPAPGHPRPNIESRLAFHDHSINPMGLNKGDILLFEPLAGDPQAVMNIYRIRPSDPRYQKLPGSQKTSAHGLLP